MNYTTTPNNFMLNLVTVAIALLNYLKYQLDLLNCCLYN